MASNIHFGQVNPGRYSAGVSANYATLHEELRTLQVGATFTATFPGRYSATCARKALTHFCRYRLLYQVGAHQCGNVLEIRRTK